MVEKVGIAAALMLLLASSARTDLLKEDMDPSILNYPKPLLCKFFEVKDGIVHYTGDFILTWAELVRIDEHALYFEKGGREFRVPSKSNYICKEFVG